MKSIRSAHSPDMIKPIEFSPSHNRSQQWHWHWNRKNAVIIVALIIVLLATTFVFTARSLVILSSPDYADISITGGFSLSLGSRVLLREGDYNLHATAPGYVDFNQPFVVDERQNQQQKIVLTKTPGVLTIHAMPVQEISLSIDNNDSAVFTDNTLALAAGEHSITISAPRYLPKTLQLIIKGKGIKQAIDVELQPAWANVTVTSSPSAAQLTVDNQLIGVTPLTTEVLQGQHQLALSLDGYTRWQQTVTLAAGENYEINPDPLSRVGAWLTLDTAPSQANITLNGEFKGQTPMILMLSADTRYQLALFKAGFKPINKKIEFDSGEKTSLVLPLTPLLANVKISTNPRDATITIDGKVVATSSRILQLPSYQQLIEVSKNGYQTKRKSLTPRPGFEQSLVFNLLTVEEAKWANVKPQITSAGGHQLLLFHPNAFVMGASRRESGQRANETLRSVKMKNSFYLSSKEVTNAQFRQFKNDHSSGNVDGHTLDSDQQPVVNIAWLTAALYCNWLSQRDALTPFYQIEANNVVAINLQANGYRLPTEAEWAWAARTRKKQSLLKFPWGDNMPPTASSGNYADSSSGSVTGYTIENYADGFTVSAPVASYSENEKKLFDMGGNVAEWVNDFYAHGGQHQGGPDPTGPSSGQYKVIRGSSWKHGTITELRFSFRDYGIEPRTDVGFRIARYLQ